ncbi:hypothetical protein [Candidatus Methylobacter favarea]|uniref:hypothetical protein n=1 Tax=Candidatus Methylobacter favarea TaxID=2707345 RepID=UPI003CCD1935
MTVGSPESKCSLEAYKRSVVHEFLESLLNYFKLILFTQCRNSSDLNYLGEEL